MLAVKPAINHHQPLVPGTWLPAWVVVAAAV